MKYKCIIPIKSLTSFDIEFGEDVDVIHGWMADNASYIAIVRLQIDPGSVYSFVNIESSLFNICFEKMEE